MRQVKTREAKSQRAASGGRRTKSKARSPEPRPRRRRAEREDHCEIDPHAVVQRLKENILFRRPMLTLTAGLVLFGGVAGVFAGGHIAKFAAGAGETVRARLADAGFAVRGIALSGNERTSEQAVSLALGIEEGRSIFAVDPASARTRLLALPWVADAEVRREFPDIVSVRLMEKRAFALWRNHNDLYVVERTGAIIMSVAEEGLRLPVLEGEGAPEAAAPLIDALGGYRAISARLKTISRVGGRRWDLILTGGVTAKLPEDGWEAQLGELERLINDKNVLERNIEIIDLRYPDNYVFRLHNGVSKPIPRQQRA